MNKDLINRLNMLKSINEVDPVIVKFFDKVNRHRAWVLKIATKLGIPKLGELHDLDKFNPNRAKAYAYNWIAKDDSWKSEYLKHKNSHVKNNKHHPQYWYDKSETMDFDSFLEMISDWVASGIVNEGNYEPKKTYKYYLEHNKDLLTPIPGIKKAAEEWMIKYANHGNKYLDRDKIKEIYDKYNKGMLSEFELGGKVDLSK